MIKDDHAIGLIQVWHARDTRQEHRRRRHRTVDGEGQLEGRVIGLCGANLVEWNRELVGLVLEDGPFGVLEARFPPLLFKDGVVESRAGSMRAVMVSVLAPSPQSKVSVTERPAARTTS